MFHTTLRRLGVGTFVLIAATMASPELFAQDAHPEAEYRQLLMGGIRAHLGASGMIVNGATSNDGHLLAHAEGLNDLAQALPDAFQEGTGGEGSDALPAIWENPADFQSKLEAFQVAAAGFLAAVQSGDDSSYADAFGEVRGTCRGCHTDYRQRND